MREKRTDIKALRSIQNIYELGEGQVFYETRNAYEIWQENPLRRVFRIPKARILLVFPR